MTSDKLVRKGEYMKKLKKYLFGFALVMLVGMCPLLLLACTGTYNGKKIEKAMDSSITVLKNHNSAEVSATNLNLVEVEGETTNLFLLDFLKEISASSQFDDSPHAFASDFTVTDGTNYMQIFTLNRLLINGNKVSVEIVYTYEDSFENADYERMEIDYDFDGDKLVSFKWYSYLASDERSLNYYEYIDETLKTINDYESDEAQSLKTEVKSKALALYNSDQVSNKTYDFGQEYVNVYNKYNPSQQIQKV